MYLLFKGLTILVGVLFFNNKDCVANLQLDI